MLSSRTVAALGGLAALIRAAAPTLTVYYGPTVVWPTDPDFVVVGIDDLMATGPSTAVDVASQDWAELGAYGKDEFFTLHGACVAWSGDDRDADACLQRAAANVALVETALRTGDGITLNGALSGPGWCSVTVTRIAWGQTQTGINVHLYFDVNCRARI